MPNLNINFDLKKDLTLIINNNIVEPINDVTLSRHLKDTPSNVSFSILKRENGDVNLGDTVLLKYKNENIFKGYIFNIDENEDELLNIKCYDQLRYFKNSHTMTIKNKTAKDVINEVCSYFKLKVGEITETGIDVAPQQIVIDGKTLFEIVYDTLDFTTYYNAKQGEEHLTSFVLYDNVGEITLKKLGDLKTDVVLSEDNILSYSYSKNIDNNTYNTIFLYSKNKASEDEEKNVIAIYKIEDSNTQKKYGMLQKVVNTDNITEEQAKKYGQDLLKFYNAPEYKFKITAIGSDINIRGGTKIAVSLKLNDFEIKNNLIVNEVNHKFNDNEYTIDLELLGVDGVVSNKIS